jgi:hypothetical protein
MPETASYLGIAEERKFSIKLERKTDALRFHGSIALLRTSWTYTSREKPGRREKKTEQSYAEGWFHRKKENA